MIWPNSARGPREVPGHWWCRQCYASGDSIEFLKLYANMSYVEACEELGIEPDHAGWEPGLSEQSQDSPPPKKWREIALNFVERAERYRPVSAILTKRSVVPYNCCYMVRSGSQSASSCLSTNLIGDSVLGILALPMLLNEHEFSSYMVRLIFSSKKHREAFTKKSRMS